MTQRQVLRQLAEAGQLPLQDFDPAGLVRLLREELVTVVGQTVTLTEKGRRLAAPRKPPVPTSKPAHPLPPPRRNYPVGRHEQPSKRGYYAAKERSRRSVRAWMERNPPLIDWSKPDPDRDERLRKLAQLLSAPLRHDDGTEWTADDYFRDRLRTHLEEPEGWLLPEEQAAANEPIWHGHGHKLDDDTFEFPLDMTSRQYFNLHARLHAERDWPHRHRRLHVDEEAWLAKDLRIPPAQLRAANAKGGMFDLTRLPNSERDRRDELLGLAHQGLRYVYTLNAEGQLRTLHQVPTEDDLYALPAHAASVLWCSELWFYLEKKHDAFMPATLESHNAAIQQVINAPEQRERLASGYVAYLECRDCAPRHHALADPAETYDSSRHVCVCGHGADHHLVGFFLIWKLRPHNARCTQCECVAFTFSDRQREFVDSR
jgi:hypothetical protein